MGKLLGPCSGLPFDFSALFVLRTYLNHLLCCRWQSPGAAGRTRRRSISAEGALAFDIVNLLNAAYNGVIRQNPEVIRWDFLNSEHLYNRPFSYCLLSYQIH